MPLQPITFRAAASPGQRHGWLIRVLGLAAIFLVLIPALFAQGQGASHKLAADFATFPINADGTVDVIIQFNQIPQARHFQMLASNGGRWKQTLQVINGAAYRIPIKLLDFLEKHPDVAYVSPDRPNAPSFDVVTAAAVTADVAKTQYGLDGSGVGVAVIDSGVFNHDDLQKADNSGSRVVYSQSFVAGDASTSDTYGHGTHVAGIVAGNGHDSQSGYAQQYKGIAVKANIVNLRVLDGNGAGSDSQVIAAIQRAIQLKSTYNIRVMNLSLGRPIFESYALDPLCQAVEAAWKSGIVVVVAAGNTGRTNSGGIHGYGTIQSPGNDPNVITVGATNTNGTLTRLDDTIASYSSKGPTLIDHIVKPDLVAPGNRVVSLIAPGSNLATTYTSLTVSPTSPLITCSLSALGLSVCTSDSSAKYLRLSGTSMATPVVSGAAALMLQKDPTLTPDIIKARMMKTAWKGYVSSSWAYDVLGNSYFSQYDVFTIGAGYLDVDAALGSTDVGNGGAVSPTAVYNSATKQVTLLNGTSITWGASIIWGSSIVWSDSLVFGSNVVINDSIIWGSTIVWGDATCTGFSIVWGVNGDSSLSGMTALSTGEDGDQ
jgi:serine protease AprX